MLQSAESTFSRLKEEGQDVLVLERHIREKFKFTLSSLIRDPIVNI